MTTLLFVEHGNGQIKDGTLKALAAAKEIGGPIHALVLGTGSKAVAEAAGKLDGVEKVLNAEDGVYDHDLAEPVSAMIAAIAEPYDTIIASASTTGKNVLPRVAALLDVAQVSDIIKVVAPDTFERPIYAGNAIQTVQAPAGKKVITVRTAAFKAAEEAAPPRRWRPCRRPRPRRAARASRVRRSPSPIGRSWPRRGSSCRVAARSARRTSSTS
ncbi:hypothetical protein ACU4GR_30805 [Methylobacterium oryzae CBMB20]